MSYRQGGRRSLGLVLAAGAMLVLAMPVAPAKADLVQQSGKGHIDWTAGTITVTGAGAPPEKGNPAQKRLLSQRAAVVDGYRQLAEIINGVHVDSETVVKDMVVESDTIKTQVSALVKGARPGAPRYLSDGAVEVDVTARLYGQDGLSAITTPAEGLVEENESALPHGVPGLQLAVASLLPPSVTGLLHLSAAPAKGRRGLSKKPPVKNTAIQPARVANHYTSVIVNCEGLGVQPAMSPTILDRSEGEIYVGRRPMPDSFIDFVISEGIVGYADNPAEARKLERAGNNPLMLKAVKVSGRLKADAVLDDESAKQLMGAESDSKILTNAKVIFVL